MTEITTKHQKTAIKARRVEEHGSLRNCQIHEKFVLHPGLCTIPCANSITPFQIEKETTLLLPDKPKGCISSDPDFLLLAFLNFIIVQNAKPTSQKLVDPAAKIRTA